MEKKAITIFTAKTARELLKDGFTLIDMVIVNNCVGITLKYY